MVIKPDSLILLHKEPTFTSIEPGKSNYSGMQNHEG